MSVSAASPLAETRRLWPSLSAAIVLKWLLAILIALVAVFPIGADGALGEAIQVIQHEGSSTHPDRQHGPHAHFTAFDPSGKHLMVCDLGLDKVMVYDFDAATGHLAPSAFPHAQVSSGAGPRHLDFAPDGSHAFVKIGRAHV